MEIHESARKHGVNGEDIEHAVEQAMAIDDQDDDTRLYLGPDRRAEMLEVLTSFATTARSWPSTRCQ